MFYFTIVVLTVLLFFIYDEVSHETKFVYKFNKNWIYNDENGIEKKIDLPEKVKTKNGEVIISKNLAKNYEKMQFLFIYTNEQDLSVSLDKKVIYNYNRNKDRRFFKKVNGRRWNKIEIPYNSVGKNISIKIHSGDNRKYETISDIYTREKNTIVLYLLRAKLAPIVGTILIFIFGLILIIGGFIFKKYLFGNKSCEYIGWFSVLSGIWLITELRVISFIIDAPVFISVLGSATLMISHIPIIQYVNNIKEYAYKGIGNILIIVFYINLIINILLQAFNLTSFFYIGHITHILILLLDVILLIILFLDLIKNKNKNVSIDIMAFSLLFIFELIEFLTLYFLEDHLNGSFLRIGIILFIIILSIKLIKLLELSKRSTYYKEAARKDFMTGFNNRNAYINDLEKIDTEKDVFVLVSDINNLKLINDKYGHKIGDEAIMNLCKILREIFQVDSKIYRIGGDEFVCFLENWSNNDVKKGINRFYKQCDEVNKRAIYRFKVALGYAKYNEKLDNNIYDTVNRADFDMYNKKRKLKQEYV